MAMKPGKARVLIHGLGVEGQAAAAYFVARGIRVRSYDPGGQRRDGVEALDEGAVCSILSPELLYLRSPGVPVTDDLYEAAIAAGATATSPTGWWLATLAPPGTICVTGTKGKSTTSALTAATLRAGGVTSEAYGNIGRPPLGPDLPAETVPVVELSSYMCADLLQPKSGRRWQHAVTNLYKEHTTWHGSETSYRTAKLRPFRFEPPCPGVAPLSLIERERLPRPVVTPIDDLATLDGSTLSVGGDKIDLDSLSDAFRSPGLRLAAKATAAIVWPILDDRTLPALCEAGRAWTGLPSRQALVPSDDGRLWIDDALATVPEAAAQALDRFEDRPVRMVLGGKDRGQDLSDLLDRIRRSADIRVYGFGEVSGQVRAAGLPVFLSMEAAVLAARDECPAGGIVLFSPAAPSGPPHADYKERSSLFGRLATESTPPPSR